MPMSHVPQFIQPECQGQAADLWILTSAPWLHDAAVQYRLSAWRGRWAIAMIFIQPQCPLQFRIRRLGTYSTQRQADQFARIFQRGIQRDARGTQQVNCHAFHICHN